MSVEVIAQLTLAAYFLLGLTIVIWRAVRSPQGWRLWLLYCIDSLYCRLCFRWRANRRCPFRDVGAAIVIANHRSPLDPLLMWVGVETPRPIGFMMAREYYELRWLHWVCKTMESIPVQRQGRDMAGTRQALRRLEEGHLLGIFPEGRINTGPGLLPANPGIAWLALKSRAPVYPVFIHNAPDGSNMIRPFFEFQPVRIDYGDPIDLADYYERPVSDELLQEVIELLMRELARLGTRAPVSRAAPVADRTALHASRI